MAERIKRMSHKELGDMSASEFRGESIKAAKRLSTYVRPYKTRFALGILFGITAGMFNGVVLFTMRAVFQVILSPDLETKIKPFQGIRFLSAGMRKFSITPPEFITRHEWVFISCVCALIPVMIMGRGLLTYLHQYFMIWVGNRVLFQLRSDVFSSLMRQPLRFYNSSRQGDLMQTVYNQTRMAQAAATDLASSLIKHPVSILVVILTLLVIDPIYTLGALLIFPLCILPVMHISRKVRKAGGKEEEEAGQMMVYMQEAFSGIRVVKAHAREDYELTRFNRASQKMLEFIMRWSKAIEISGPMVEGVASIGIAAGLVYARVTHIAFEDFLLLNMALMSMYPPAKALGRIQIQFQKCIIAVSKVFDLIDTKPELADAPDAIDIKEVDGPLVLDKVSFAYIPGTPAVEDISLTFEPGKFYALVGKSGSGKSTLLSLIMRFYDPDSGSISIKGTDIRKVTQTSLRDHIGLVLQETFLFHDSILNNIRYGRLDATKKEVIAAAKKANAHGFIMKKEEGYNTVCGDKGAQLSGGQQQRISIARTFLRDAPILLLDEATSSLDSDSERKVQDAFEKLEKGKTVIAIAHRLSTILNCDQIVVMNQGKIEAVGRHEELLEVSDEYRLLYNLQFNNHNEKTELSQSTI
jgi:subfamily B ATP-binding cassette protein MsbA